MRRSGEKSGADHDLAVLDREDRVGGLGDEVAVVRHRDHGAVVLADRVLEDLYIAQAKMQAWTDCRIGKLSYGEDCYTV